MSKFKREFVRLKPSECDFMFYTTSGSWGMYSMNIRHYWFCIPFIFGFRYTKSWGTEF